MKLFRNLLAGLILTGCAMAQTTPPPPALNASQQIALNAVFEKLQENLKEHDGLLKSLHAIETEFAAQHPGFHFDENTGQVVKDAPKAEGKK